mgnify:CR=1 FL=1
MARPQRNNVDYFPFICEDGNKMFYLEETYGNDGFASFLKILRELAKADFHYLDLSKPATKMFLSAKCKVSKEVLEAIIKDLVELEKFDSELWNENSIIWCQDFIDSIQDAYSKRSNNCIDRNSLLLLLQSKGIRKPLKSTPKQSKPTLKDPVNPQSIVEYSKLNKSKEETNKALPFSFFNSLILLGADKQLASDFIKVRKVKKATNTLTAFNGFKKQLEKSGLNINKVLLECVEKSWGSFKAEWSEQKKEGASKLVYKF